MRLVHHPSLEPLYRKSHFVTLLIGGRGGGKTFGLCDYVLWLCRSESIKVLCMRQYLATIEDSLKADLEGRIVFHGLGGEFVVTKSRLRHCVTGSEVVFKGLDKDPNAIKSVGGVGLAVIDEAQTIRRASWNKFLPSIRKGGCRIVVSMNPEYEDDPVYKDLVVDRIYRDNQLVVEMPWWENPFYTEELDMHREAARLGDADLYRNEWGGEVLRYSDKLVFRRGVNWDVDDEVEVPVGAAVYYGRDLEGSSANTASAVVGLYHWMDGVVHRAHVFGERYGKGMTRANEVSWLDSVYVAGSERVVRSDVQMLQHGDMRREGDWDVRWSRKPRVVEGVRWLKRGCYLTVSSSCVNLVEELGGYSWRVDKDGEVLEELAKGQRDHAIDAVRYALEGVMYRGVGKGVRSSGAGMEVYGV